MPDPVISAEGDPHPDELVGTDSDLASLEDDDAVLGGPRPATLTELDIDDDGEADFVVAETLQTTAVVQVHKPKCLTCTHLVSFGTKTYSSCHYSAGNDVCPAKTMKITEHIPIDAILAAFKEAEANSDLERVSRLYAQIAKRPDWVQQRITDALKEARSRKDW